MQADQATSSSAAEDEAAHGKGMQFSDKDEHIYFWFPLLAGLSELTFDPRSELRHSALGVCHLPPPSSQANLACWTLADTFRGVVCFPRSC